MKILILGGNGMLGPWAVKAMRDRHDILLTDINDPHPDYKGEFLKLSADDVDGVVKAAEGMDVIHLEIGEPDFDTSENVINAGSDALNNGFTHYNPSPGFDELRDRIAQEISSTRGISVTGDNVVVTPGGKPIMFFKNYVSIVCFISSRLR